MNRLARETSPYLRQHEKNPVDWYPWGPEVLEKAKRENKPILLSVGYSSCHWCHVMAHESFESETVAQALNESFVSIKVDREERPDLDQVYQNVAQAMTGGGGWPLTVFLPPDLRPFYGGTYFPPEDRYGRPGFLRLVHALAKAFTEDRATVEENAEKLTAMIRQLESTASRREGVTVTVTPDSISPHLKRAAEKLLQGVDWDEGGMGGAPKFPNPGIFTFLWRYGKTLPKDSELGEQCLNAVVITLMKMARGGIFDQLGGGFARYSTDEKWQVPHFEKMLSDNALLLQLYSGVLATDQIAPEPLLQPEIRALFLETVRKTVGYLLREMKVPGGAFYSAQDADTEGEEGKFFVWTPSELQTHLGEDRARVFALRYGVSEGGNFEHGTTVLHQAHTIPEVARELVMNESEVKHLLESAETTLPEIRGKRVRPGLDDKTLVSWSSLMVSALAFAAEALRIEGDPELAGECARAAEEALETLRTKGVDANGQLLATIQKGQGRFAGYLDDHAFLARAALDLSRVIPARAEALRDFSAELLERIVTRFRDEKEAGYFFVAHDHESLLTRPKSIYDQAIPSGTAVTLGLLLWHLEFAEDPVRLSSLRAELDFQSDSLFGTALQNPFGHGELLCAVLQAGRGSAVVEGTEEQLREILGQPEVLPKGLAAPGPVPWCTRMTCTEVRGSLVNHYWEQLGRPAPA